MAIITHKLNMDNERKARLNEHINQHRKLGALRSGADLILPTGHIEHCHSVKSSMATNEVTE
jgi:hypothetical protein